MRLTDREGQSRLVFGRLDEVDVVGHQAIGPAGDAAAPELLSHQAQTDRLVAELEKDALEAVPRSPQ